MTNWEFAQRFQLSVLDGSVIAAYRGSIEDGINRFISWLIKNDYTDTEILDELSLSYPELTMEECSRYVTLCQNTSKQVPHI